MNINVGTSPKVIYDRIIPKIFDLQYKTCRDKTLANEHTKRQLLLGKKLKPKN